MIERGVICGLRMKKGSVRAREHEKKYILCSIYSSPCLERMKGGDVPFAGYL